MNYLTTEQTAKKLKCSTSAIRHKASSIKGAIKMGRDWLIPKSWIASQKENKLGRPRQGFKKC